MTFTPVDHFDVSAPLNKNDTKGVVHFMVTELLSDCLSAVKCVYPGLVMISRNSTSNNDFHLKNKVQTKAETKQMIYFGVFSIKCSYNIRIKTC